MDNESRIQTFSWWIVSLAISITCCAVLFVIFAGYLVGIKEEVAVDKMRLEMADQRFALMSNELETLRRHGMVQQIQMLPTPATAPIAPSAAPLPIVLAPTIPPANAAVPVPTGDGVVAPMELPNINLPTTTPASPAPGTIPADVAPKAAQPTKP